LPRLIFKPQRSQRTPRKAKNKNSQRAP
jgi:hypothetical protein